LRYQAALHPDTVYSRAMLRSKCRKVNAWLIPFSVDFHPGQKDNALPLKRP